MAPPSDGGELTAAWRALAAESSGPNEGWRSITLANRPGMTLLAGIRFPALEEALLAGFPRAALPPGALPEGRGFSVESIPAVANVTGRDWLALTRVPAASLELFGAMAEDVTALVVRAPQASEAGLAQLFLNRIRAWQAFMSRAGDDRLEPEQELGLIGELAVLEALLDGGVKALDAVVAWQGPLDGLQDFQLGSGALEVKTTIAASGFRVRISSLEQLDDALLAPLFLAAVRATLNTAGETLPERLGRLRNRFAGEAASAFNRRLLQAGYLDAHADSYDRRIVTQVPRLLPVVGDLPRLRRTDLPPAIRAAEYEVDLDMVATMPVTILDMLNQLGFSSS